MRHVDVLELEERAEDRMVGPDFDELMIGQRTPDLLFHVVPLVRLEVIEDEEAALEEVISQVRGLRFLDAPVARLGNVDDRVPEDLGIVERRRRCWRRR